MKKFTVIAMAMGVGLAGCAAAPLDRPATLPAESAAPAPTTASARANVALADLTPVVTLPPGKGSGSGVPPISAEHLFARAHAAQLDGDRADAITLLEKAAVADPASFLLHVELGHLYLAGGANFDDRSIAHLEKAAALDPDHLDLQTDLGRQYMAKGDAARALAHLRQGLLTHEYTSDPNGAAIDEFFLGTLLRAQGYTQAALETYQRLAARLHGGTVGGRRNSPAAALLDHVDEIDAEIADLLARAGRFDESIAAFAQLIKQHPGDFGLRAREVHLLAALRRGDEAIAGAEEAVIRFHANPDAVALLADASSVAGKEGGAAAALSRLHDRQPKNADVLCALVDELRRQKKSGDAQHALDTFAGDASDLAVLRRQVLLAMDRRDSLAAARALVNATARDPEIDVEVAPLFALLTRSSPNGPLRLDELRSLKVPPDQEACRNFWVWRVASAARREDIGRAALQKSLDASPPFPPAFREQVDVIWDRSDLSDAKKIEASEQLAARAERDFGPRLADEARGVALLRQGKAAEAAERFASAMRAGGSGASLLLSRAAALRQSGHDGAADSLLWKLISDHPLLNSAYLDLYLSSLRRDMEPQAERVVSQWLAVAPDSVQARRVQAIQYQRAGRIEAAERILLRLFHDHPDDPEAVGALQGFDEAAKHSDRFIHLLKEQFAQEPWNTAVSGALAEALAKAGDLKEAAKVCDGARAAAQGNSDLLYLLSGVYSRLGLREQSEQTLSEVLKLDATHAGAANDLGYSWAEQGRNLPRAQTLIEQAMAADPANTAYLDSMGWVLYKRGRFAEARQFLDRAVGDTATAAIADPVVLDHRGDALYRLGEKEAARADWTEATGRIDALHENLDEPLRQLHAALLDKVDRLKTGQPVPTAPVVEEVPTAAQSPSPTGSRQ